MARSDDTTRMGGEQRQAGATRWSQIAAAQQPDDEALRRTSVEELAKTYWKPVYCYIRHMGYGNEDAKDFTQGFFAEVFPRLVARADRGKGRFRAFLVRALHAYVVSQRRRERAQRRMPAGWVLRLDGVDLPSVSLPSPGADPQGVFAYAWASAILDKALAKVASACQAEGKGVHWQVFRTWVVDPAFARAERPSIEAVCQEFAIQGQKVARNMLITVARRLQKAIRQEIGQFVGSEAEVDDEIRDLMRVLSDSCAAS